MVILGGWVFLMIEVTLYAMVILGGWAFSYERGTPVQGCHAHEEPRLPYRGTSLIRNTHPPKITIGP